MILPWVGSLLLLSMQDEETLHTVRRVVRDGSHFMPCGTGTAGKELRFSRFGLDGAKAKCDLVATIIGIVDAKDLQWAMEGGKAEDEPGVRTSLSLGAHYILSEYHREFSDKRVEEYFRRVAFDRSRHIHVRRSAASNSGRD